jgi:hypothetical protein
MGQQAVDAGALVKAIQADPSKLADFLVKNPGVKGMLAAVYPELKRASESNLVAALQTLPAPPALTKEFQPLVQLNNGTLEARQGTHSAFEFRLTLKNVQPGQTQEKLEALVAEINERFPSMQNVPSCGFKVYLSKNGDLPQYSEAGNVVIKYSSLITDSTTRHRDQTITHHGEKRISQKALLSQHGLVEVANDVVRVNAGMYRLAHGFPANKDDIGTERDKGDVFEGKVARTKEGSSSGSAASYQYGVDVDRWLDGDRAHARDGVVGGLSPEFEKLDR